MKDLNLPSYPLRFRELDGKKQVFDVIRKKFVALTPEEWVRQNFLWYLLNDKELPSGWCKIENKLVFNGLTRRSDILICNSIGEPRIVVECKAPEVALSAEVMDQIVRYNWVLKAPYIIVTNGLRHIACHIDHQNKSYSFLQEIPGKSEL